MKQWFGNRWYSTTTFARDAKILHRERAARRVEKGVFASREYDYLHTEIAGRLMDRLDDVRAHQFQTVVELGSRGSLCLQHTRHRQDIRDWIQIQPSHAMLVRDNSGDEEFLTRKQGTLRIHRIVADEETIPIADKSVDLIVSNLAFHWINNVPGTLAQIFRVLKDDGLFIASMFGENTLLELRNSMLLAEQEREGGVSAHVSPFAGIADVGNTLSRAGFTLPAVDQETITVKFKDPYLLMNELQAMAEQNAVSRRRPFTSRDTFHAAAAIYRELYGDEEGAVPATFQIIYMTGWTPHASQQKPKTRGSATRHLSDMTKPV